MSNNINLLENKKKLISVITKTTSQLLRFSAVSLLFIVSVSSIILFILIALSPLPKLKQEEHLTMTTLSQYHTGMLKLFLIKERTSLIDKVLSKRMLYDIALDDIHSKLPDGVEVSSFSVEKNTLSLTVSSKSLELLNTFISNLTNSVNEKKSFSLITMSRLSMEKERKTYVVTLTLLLV